MILTVFCSAEKYSYSLYYMCKVILEKTKISLKN